MWLSGSSSNVVIRFIIWSSFDASIGVIRFISSVVIRFIIWCCHQPCHQVYHLVWSSGSSSSVVIKFIIHCGHQVHHPLWSSGSSSIMVIRFIIYCGHLVLQSSSLSSSDHLVHHLVVIRSILWCGCQVHHLVLSSGLSLVW